MSWTRLLYLLLAMAFLALFLTACSLLQRAPITAAPDVIQYKQVVETKAADELSGLGPACPRDAVFGGCSALRRLVNDYKWTRDQIRALKE